MSIPIKPTGDTLDSAQPKIKSFLKATIILVTLSGAPFSAFLLGNRDHITISDLWPFAVFYIGILLSFLAGLRILFGVSQATKFAYVLGWLGLSFLSYQPITEFLEIVFSNASTLLKMIFWILITGSTVCLFWRYHKVKRFQQILLWFSVLIFLIPLIQYSVISSTDVGNTSYEVIETNTNVDAWTDSPDIYFFLLDNYGREDVLRHFFQFDTTDFLDTLKDEHFVIADRALSAHPMTWLSLPAIFEQEYQVLPQDSGPIPSIREQTPTMAGANRTYRILDNQGYRFVTATAHNLALCDPSPIQDIELCVGHSPDETRALRAATIQYELLSRTPLPGLIVRNLLPSAIVARLIGSSNRWNDGSVGGKAFRATDIIAAVESSKLIDPNAPVFTFAHMLYAHPPFTLDSNCNYLPALATKSFLDNLDGSQYLDAYRMGIECTQNELLDIISQIDPFAVVIIQSDHGPGHGINDQLNSRLDNLDNPGVPIEYLWKRASVFSAIRLPKSCSINIPDTYAGVNTFMAVFACLSGQPIDLQPDRSIWAWYSHNEVTDISSLLHHYEASIRTGS
jgi:hypothetical protein